jgi:thiamine-phosphate pyrophosphorylase
VTGEKAKRVDFKLYLVTDRKLVTHYSSLLTAVRHALKGGVKAVQIREKDLSTRELIMLSYKLRYLTERYQAKLFINDRVDIALAVGADGVHLTQASIPADAVKRALKDKLLIGVSTHSLKEARNAERAGADFITFGPVYKTPSKLKYGPPLGIEALTEVCRRIRIPVFAIGGVKARRIGNLVDAGVYGVAMISEILGARNIQKKAEELTNMIENI